ncbi:outer membrane beta-barrel protein [Dyella monticola]|nr:outer membrane beta-barrel protein [Dyella monticola]
MDKRISMIAVAFALAAVSSSAMAVDGNFFVNGEVAGSNANISNLQNTTSTAGAVRLGYLWNGGPMTWGVEAGYVDLGKVTGSYNDYTYTYGYSPSLHASVTNRGSMLGGNFKAHFGQSDWFVSSRLGWYHSNVHATVNDAYGTTSSSASGDGVYAGIGLGYDFTQHAGIAFNYDSYQTHADGIYSRRFNTGMYGATFEYRF